MPALPFSPSIPSKFNFDTLKNFYTLKKTAVPAMPALPFSPSILSKFNFDTLKKISTPKTAARLP